jgi:hypothetical protein
MVKLPTHYWRATSFALVVFGLVAFMGVLVSLLFLVMWYVPRAHDPPQKQYLARLAQLLVALLLLTGLMLIAAVAHYISQRLKNPPEPFKPMGYEDAWSEGGRRLKPENAPPVEPWETPGGEKAKNDH